MQAISLPPVEIGGKPYEADRVTGYYNPVFYALSGLFDTGIIEQLQADMSQYIAERRQFVDLRTLDEYFFDGLLAKTNSMIRTQKLYDQTLPACHVLSDTQDAYLKARTGLEAYFGDQGIWAREAIKQLCYVTSKTLGKRSNTVSAYRHMIKKLQEQCPDYDLWEYKQV